MAEEHSRALPRLFGAVTESSLSESATTRYKHSELRVFFAIAMNGLDLTYTIMVYRKSKQQGIDPWRPL